MSKSLPSRPITVIDVPDTKGFSAEFVYNYHVPDEGSNPKGGIPKFALERSSEGLDNSFLQYSTTRVPRYIKFEWQPVDSADIFDSVFGDVSGKEASIPKNYIKSNLDKIVSEETFSTDGFSALVFGDQSIDRKLYNEVSSSMAILNEENEQASTRGVVAKTDELTKDIVSFQSLSAMYAQPSENNVFYFGKEGDRIRNDTINKLKDFYLPGQINSSYLRLLTRRAMMFSESTYDSSYAKLHELSKRGEIEARKHINRSPNVNEYTSFVQHVNLKKIQTSFLPPRGRTRVVGYIIEKQELLLDGSIVEHPHIVIENPQAKLTIDTDVKYYSSYRYSIRTIAEFVVPTVIEETSDTVLAYLLVASRRSAAVIIQCAEYIPPPCPVELGAKYNRESENLFLHWKLPVNPQRDIKQVQLFRRSSPYHPFQLISQSDFDDSEVPAPYHEEPSGLRIIKNKNPSLSYYDSDFTREKEYIYALCAIDAHGMTSNYSEQIKVSFDSFKNKLIVQRVSESGAPKPHPNMFFKKDLFIDTIVSKGKNKMKIILSPEHMRVIDQKGNDLKVLKPKENGGRYLLQGINTDVGKGANVEIFLTNQSKKNQP